MYIKIKTVKYLNLFVACLKQNTSAIKIQIFRPKALTLLLENVNENKNEKRMSIAIYLFRIYLIS